MYELKRIQEIENSLWQTLFKELKDEHILTNEVLEDSIFLQKRIQALLAKQEIVLPKRTLEKITRRVLHRINGLGPLEDILEDDSITEVMVNGKDSIFIEKNGVLQKTKLFFSSDEELLNIINKIVSKVGRRIDESSPMVDARLPDGSRVNAIIPPLSLGGPTLTIRKFSKTPFSLDDLIKKGSLSKEMRDFLQQCIDEKENMVISGGTGTGKTSLLNALSKLIDHKERIITIEDSAELQLEHPNLVSLESRPPNIEGKGAITIRDLVKNSLRMRPDRIVVGEIRSGESLDMLQAMNTGHEGSLTTVHANAPLEALYRLETMVLMGSVELPLQAIRQQIIGGITIIIQLERMKDGRRRIVRISRLLKDLAKRERGEYELEDIFAYDYDTDTHFRVKK